MKTNTKIVSSKVKVHIMGFYDDDIKTFENDMKAVFGMNETPTVYHAIAYMVQGGSFLIYYSEVKDFLNGLGINPENKEYSDEKSWELYKHLIALNGEKLLKVKK